MIPNQLKKHNHWVGYIFEGDTKKVRNVNNEPTWKESNLWGSYDEVVKLQEQHKWDGIGFIVTPECPFTVIDIDDCFDANGEWQDHPDGKFTTADVSVIAESQFANCPQFRSPSKTGLHIWMEGKPENKLNRGPQDHKIEIYGGKRFMTFTGDSYNDVNEIVNCQGLLDRVVGWAVIPKLNTSIGAVATVDIPMGERNNYFVTLAGSLVNLGYSGPALEIALQSRNAGLTNPLSDSEIEGIVHSARSFKPGADPVFQSLKQNALSKIGKTTGKTTTKSKVNSFITLEEAFSNPDYLIEPEWDSPWLCQTGRCTLFIGEPSAAKSWIACADALEAVRRNDKRVLYINVDEPPADLIRRFKNFNEPKISKMISILNPEEMNLTWEILFETIEAFDPQIVYFDSWDKLVGMLNNGIIPQSHENTKWREIIDQFTVMARKYSLALCILIHTTKANPRLFSGNQQIMAAVDIAIVVQKTQGIIRELEYSKRVVRDPVLLEWQKDGDGSQKEVNAAPSCRDWMLLFFGDGFSHKTVEIQTAGKISNYNQRDINQTRNNLVNDGLVEKSRQHKEIDYKITQAGQNELVMIQNTALINKLKQTGTVTLP